MIKVMFAKSECLSAAKKTSSAFFVNRKNRRRWNTWKKQTGAPFPARSALFSRQPARQWGWEIFGGSHIWQPNTAAVFFCWFTSFGTYTGLCTDDSRNCDRTKTGLSAIGAYGALNRKFSFLGVLTAVIPVIILPYYSVIGGWVLKYLAVFCPAPEPMQRRTDIFRVCCAALSAAALVSAFYRDYFCSGFARCRKGCGKVQQNHDALFSCSVHRHRNFVVCQPGAMDGVAYYLKPDFSKFTPMTLLAAMGQLFYSMSLAMGIMVTYGSYMKKDVNLDHAVSRSKF